MEHQQIPVSNWASHWHIGYTLIFCILGIIIPIYFLGPISLIQYLTIPLSFLFRHFIEYFVHKEPLHYRYRGLAPLFDLHMLHHDYFDHKNYQITKYADMSMVVFPPIVLNMITLTLTPVFLILRAFSLNVALLFVITIMAYYLVMQVTHATSHVREGHWLLRIPGLHYLWVHHYIHHDKKLMSKWNFGFVVPWSDIVMKTNTLDVTLVDNK